MQVRQVFSKMNECEGLEVEDESGDLLVSDNKTNTYKVFVLRISDCKMVFKTLEIQTFQRKLNDFVLFGQLKTLQMKIMVNI